MIDRPLVIIGISGFGRETADVVDAMQRPVMGFLDDSPSAYNLGAIKRRGNAFLGPINQWLANPEPHDYLVGIGCGLIRQQVAKAMEAAGHHAGIAIHPTATMGHSVYVSPGVVICAGVSISNNVHLGRHAHLNPGAVIGHDSSLGDWVSVNPSAIISGAVRVKDRTLVGAGATVLQNLTIEGDVTIGAGAVVTKDVPSHVTVTGVPGRWR